MFSPPPPAPPPVWFMDACWPQSMRNWSKELGRYCEWSCCRRRVNWKEGIEKTDVRRHQRAAEERRARRKNSSSFPSSIIICAVCSASGDRHSRIGLHSYTSRCNTTTDIDWSTRAHKLCLSILRLPITCFGTRPYWSGGSLPADGLWGSFVTYSNPKGRLRRD